MNFEKRILADGQATLYRGDSLELLRAGVFGKIGAIVSDPPYGIGFQHGGGGTSGNVSSAGIHNLKPIHGDDAPFDPQPWIDAAPRNERKTETYGGLPLIVLFGADNYMQRLPAGGTLLAWDKHIGRGADDSFSDCEWAWCGRKVKREVFRWLWKGVVSQKTELDHPPQEVKGGNGFGAARFARVHVSQKPVELMRWCIDKVRPLAGLPILDPYLGSGSTAIAALSLGHSFVGCEIDPDHFEVACKRVEAYWQRTHADEEALMPLFAWSVDGQIRNALPFLVLASAWWEKVTQAAVREEYRLKRVGEVAQSSAMRLPESEKQEFAEWVANVLADGYLARHEFRKIGYLPQRVLQDADVAKIGLMRQDIETSDYLLRHGYRQSKGERGASLSASDLATLPLKLESSTWMFDQKHKNVVAFFEIDDQNMVGKAVVHFNYARKGNTHNAVITTGIVKRSNIQDGEKREI